MVLEASQMLTATVVSIEDKKLAVVDKIIFAGGEVKVAGFQVKLPGVLSATAALDYEDVLSCGRQTVVVDNGQQFSRDLTHFNDLRQRFGEVINVPAKTESGQRIGRVSDVVIDVDTGLIIRFYLRELIRERIIPRQFLVAITPKAVVFKDVVIEPLFDEMITAPIGA